MSVVPVSTVSPLPISKTENEKDNNQKGSKPIVDNPLEREKLHKQIAKKERKRIEEICKRQEKLLNNEINQSWRIVFGDVIPEKYKNTFVIKNVTRRNVWMEPFYLFNIIKSFQPMELFHNVEEYSLKWQPPQSLFKLMIPLNDPLIQENAIVEINKLSKQEQKEMLFFFSPIKPTQKLFAPPIHPALLVEFNTKNQILKKLCDYFLDGKISIEEIQQTFLCGVDVWKSTLYNYLPEDWQKHHEYLNDRNIIKPTNKEIGKKYLDNEITLQEYEDMKYPKRKQQKDIEALSYPRPYEKFTCIICSTKKEGIIQCTNCTSMVCVPCVDRHFSMNSSTAEGSFLLLHQKYCLRLGKMMNLQPVPVSEPGYLREFRLTSRTNALKLLEPPQIVEAFDMESLDTDSDDSFEEELKQKASEAARILAMQNPVELQAIQRQLDDKKKKFEKYKKEYQELQARIDAGSRNVQFIERTIRLKNELVAKVDRNIVKPLHKLLDDLAYLRPSVTGKYIIAVDVTLKDLLNATATLIATKEKEETPPTDDDEK